MFERMAFFDNLINILIWLIFFLCPILYGGPFTEPMSAKWVLVYPAGLLCGLWILRNHNTVRISKVVIYLFCAIALIMIPSLWRQSLNSFYLPLIDKISWLMIVMAILYSPFSPQELLEKIKNPYLPASLLSV